MSEQSVDQLEQEARRAVAAAGAARTRENAAVNDSASARRLAEAIAEAEDPARRDRDARLDHQNSAAYKAAREHAHEVLLEVRDVCAALRNAGIDQLDPSDKRDLMARLGKDVTTRMSEQLRSAAERMLNEATSSGDMGRVEEWMRAGVLQTAGASPFHFEKPASPADDPAALAALIRGN
jgi:hypothetical protein